MKKILGLLALVSMLGLGGLSASDKLTTVGVVNIERVFTTYYEQSAAVREYNQARLDVQEQLRVLSQELIALTSQRIEAQRAGNQAETLRIDQELQAKARYINDFRTVKNQELSNMKAALDSGDTFQRELANAIEVVAVSQGFTIMLQVGTEGSPVYWWASEVDMTNRVIEQLRRTLR